MFKRLLAVAAAAAVLMVGATGVNAKVITLFSPQTGFTTIDTDSRYIAPGGHQYSPIPRETVKYDGPYGANTIVINTSERRLYYVQGDGTALKYGIGVGRDGFTWSGTDRISRKA